MCLGSLMISKYGLKSSGLGLFPERGNMSLLYNSDIDILLNTNVRRDRRLMLLVVVGRVVSWEGGIGGRVVSWKVGEW